MSRTDYTTIDQWLWRGAVASIYSRVSEHGHIDRATTTMTTAAAAAAAATAVFAHYYYRSERLAETVAAEPVQARERGER